MKPARPVVLLTGLPSNFLARHVLESLLVRPEVRVKIVVPDAQHDQTRAIVEAAASDGLDRVEILRGDTTAMDFGMAGPRFLALAREIDVIQHCACAGDSGVSRDAELRTFLGSTGEVLELALASEGRLQRLVYWGSALLSEPVQGRVSESALIRPSNFRSTGAAVRFQAEQLMRDSMVRVPITILRPTILVGDSRTGESDPLSGIHLLVLLMLSSPVDLRLPLPGRGDQPLNLIPVDYVVSAGLTIADDPRSAGTTFNLVDERPLSVRQAFELIAQATERPGPSGKLSTNLASVLLRTPGLERFSHVPRAFLEQLANHVIYDARNARELLAGTSLSSPSAESSIKLMVDWAKREQAARVKRKATRRNPHFEELDDPLDS